jgi:hypothetical protein
VNALTLNILNPEIHSIKSYLSFFLSGILWANILIAEPPSFTRAALLKLDGLRGSTPHRCRATICDLTKRGGLVHPNAFVYIVKVQN